MAGGFRSLQPPRIPLFARDDGRCVACPARQDWAAWAVIELTLVLLAAPKSWLAILVAVTWPGVWLDLALGNVTIALTAAAILALRSDRVRSGIVLGVALALAPKPMFVLVLVWMVVHQRRTLLGVIAGGLTTTALGCLVAGPTAYLDFARALAAGVDSHFVGNYGLSFVSPVLGVAAFVVVAIVALACIRRPADGLMAAAIAGTFAGTYVGLYSTILPLAILPSFARDRPVAAVRVPWRACSPRSPCGCPGSSRSPASPGAQGVRLPQTLHRGPGFGAISRAYPMMRSAPHLSPWGRRMLELT